MPKRFRCVPFVILFLAACSSDQSKTSGRSIVTLTDDTAWVANVANGQMLYSPAALSAGDSTIYVLEESGKQVVALSERAGAVRWRAGRVGHGPGEFMHPYELHPASDGGVVVFDPSEKRLTHVSADGSIGSIVPVNQVSGFTRWSCVLNGNRYLIGLMYSDTVVEIDEKGSVLRKVIQPWHLENPATDLNEPPMYNDQTGKTCVSTFASALGFSRYEAYGFGPVRNYVEHLEMPYFVSSSSGRDSVNTRVYGPRSAYVRRDTLWLLFSGATDHERKLIDLYSTESGKYLSSMLLPSRASAVAVTDELVVAIVKEEDDSESVLALRRLAKSTR